MKKRKEKRKHTFLCKEPGGSNLIDEEFTIEAISMEDAREKASMWNATVIKKLKDGGDSPVT